MVVFVNKIIYINYYLIFITIDLISSKPWIFKLNIIKLYGGKITKNIIIRLRNIWKVFYLSINLVYYGRKNNNLFVADVLWATRN